MPTKSASPPNRKIRKAGTRPPGGKMRATHWLSSRSGTPPPTSAQVTRRNTAPVGKFKGVTGRGALSIVRCIGAGGAATPGVSGADALAEAGCASGGVATAAKEAGGTAAVVTAASSANSASGSGIVGVAGVNRAPANGAGASAASRGRGGHSSPSCRRSHTKTAITTATMPSNRIVSTPDLSCTGVYYRQLSEEWHADNRSRLAARRRVASIFPQTRFPRLPKSPQR